MKCTDPRIHSIALKAPNQVSRKQNDLLTVRKESVCLRHFAERLRRSFYMRGWLPFCRYK